MTADAYYLMVLKTQFVAKDCEACFQITFFEQYN